MRPEIPSLAFACFLGLLLPAAAVEWGAADMEAVQWSALVAASEKCRLSIPIAVVSRAKIQMQKTWGVERYISVDETIVKTTWYNMDTFRPQVLASYCDFIVDRLAAASSGREKPEGVMPSEWLNARSRIK